jgi:hypothetical protein
LSVTTGCRRWGRSSYTLSSTIFGSIIRRRSCAGAYRYTRLVMMVFMHTDLPEPVAPAMSRCGMRARSAQ